jgi:hypothetical protein
VKDNALTRMWSVSAAALLAAALAALWVWPKLFGVEVHPIFGWAEAQSGAGWLEPGARWAVGGVAALIALLLLAPKTRLAAAWAALSLSLLFIIAHLTPWLGINIPSYAPLMEALAAGQTASQIEALGLSTDKGAHFTLAMINAGLAVIAIGAELALRRPKSPTLASVLAASPT